MSTIAIRVENISKRYRIGLKEEMPDTLVGAISSFARSPLQNFRKLRRLSQFDEGLHEPEDVLWALKNVSFEVNQGEVLGIIGRNGAGKSTLLKILAGITHPTQGRVELNGRVASLLEVGTGFHPELTGRDNIYLNGTILGMTKQEIDRKFDEIIEFSGVKKFIDTPVKRYSSGMRMRLAFSVAAHLEPEILLVDEVLAVGDEEFQKKCIGMMGEVASEGRTVLFVSHNMGAISNLTSRCIYVDGGRIVNDGPTEESIDQYFTESIPDQKSNSDGIVLLKNATRVAGNHQISEFEWIRLLDISSAQTLEFVRESEPIIIEVGIRIKKKIRTLQYALGIGQKGVQGMLIMVISPLMEKVLEPGIYTSKLKIDPNYLRKGEFSVILKMFADGFRQEGLPNAMQINVVSELSHNDNPAYLANWAQSKMRFDYEWGVLTQEQNGEK